MQIASGIGGITVVMPEFKTFDFRFGNFFVFVARA
jgi:hypothetical protein